MRSDSITFQHLTGLILGKVADESRCGASVGNTSLTDYVFAAADALITEALKVLILTIEIMHKEVNLWDLRSSSTRQMF